MSAQQKCPHCGHENLKRAVFCFQCGYRFGVATEEEAGGDVTRRSQRIIQALWDTEAGADAGLMDGDVSPELPVTGLLRDMQFEEPLTCLSCGALNRPNARFCTACGTALTVPDQDAHLVAYASARTDVGLVRDNNEDSIGLWAAQGVLLALVADGMGGAVAGEEASRLTVESIQADFVGGSYSSGELLTLAEGVITDKLMEAIQAANLAVMNRVDEDSDLRGMGTTATLAFVRGRRALFSHVGDSRAYLVDGEQGWVNQITSDHSFVEALLAAGHITADEAENHPMRNVLYRALGQTADTLADVYDRYLKSGDRIVLCSDGLTRHVSPEEIAQVVLQDNDPELATKRLIDLANSRGGQDNISAIVILMKLASDDTVELEALEEDDGIDGEDTVLLRQDVFPGDDDTIADDVRVQPPSDVERSIANELLNQMLSEDTQEPSAGADDFTF